jgi:hypothetical protein
MGQCKGSEKISFTYCGNGKISRGISPGNEKIAKTFGR